MHSYASDKGDTDQPTFDATRDAAVKAKQDEIDRLKAPIEAANNDPVMKRMREAVEDADCTGGKTSSGNGESCDRCARDDKSGQSDGSRYSAALSAAESRGRP